MEEDHINKLIDEKKENERNLKKMIAHQKSMDSKNTREAKVDCSSCGMPMKKAIADVQIENNRENAPICVPCIMGYRASTRTCGTKLSTD